MEPKIYEVTCLKCGHKWKPRRTPVRICPKCRNLRWDEPKKNKESEKE